jgi:hypothetical protein
MPRFLPRLADNVQEYSANAATDTFIADQRELIMDVAKNMSVDGINDVGRVPSLMSRAYSFYLDLFPGVLAENAATRDDRREALNRARREFRGIAATLALRDYLDLDIRLVTFDPDEGGNAPSFRRAFRTEYRNEPGFSGKMWRQFRYLIIRTAIGGNMVVDEPLCALSPYTLFFPAAAPIEKCAAIFWYTPKTGWYDPTVDWDSDESPELLQDLPRVSSEVIRHLRGLILAWLDQVLNNGALEEAWEGFGVLDRNMTSLLRAELIDWRNQIMGLTRADIPNTPRLEAVKFAPAHSVVGSELEKGVQLAPEITVPILEHRLSGHYGGFLTELPEENGRLIVSAKILADEGLRVCGRKMGGKQFATSLAAMNVEGDELQLLGYRIKKPYVCIDKLFLDSIHLLADGRLSSNFFYLSTGRGEFEYWMFPFRPEVLHYVNIELLRSNDEKTRTSQISARRISENGKQFVEVTLNVGKHFETRKYSDDQRNRDTAGNSLDIRVWPNIAFSFSSEQSIVPTIPARASDCFYYFRVRQQEAWNLEINIIASKVAGLGSPTRAKETSIFSPDFEQVGWQPRFGSFRLADSFAFSAINPKSAESNQSTDGAWEPIGLNFNGRGFCLLRLAKPRLESPTPVRWRIAVDFGTSNTCITYRPLVPGAPMEGQPLQFGVQTSTLHNPPKYDKADEDSCEGAAAVLDFPFRFEQEKDLTTGPHFPSLVVTRQITVPNGEFRFSNGLLFPRNAVTDSREFSALLKDFPTRDEHPQNRPFMLLTDTKWNQTEHRKTFLWHLCKMIVYEAAKYGAVVHEAAFSFPRAFSGDRTVRYSNDLEPIFSKSGIQFNKAVDFITESEAVHRWFALSGAQDLNHLVIDVGGGTTDYLAVVGRSALLQSSYCLAGSYINDYFVASPVLRNAMWKAIQQRVPAAVPGTPLYNYFINQRTLLGKLMGDINTLGTGDVKYCCQAFFAMLALIEEDQYALIADDLRQARDGSNAEAEQKAVCGFFYTLVLLYTGLVYQAGKLFEQEHINPQNLKINFIGNGSKIYKFLPNENVNFNSVLANVFDQAVSRTTGVRTEVIGDGKTLVARGLLHSIPSIPNKEADYQFAPVIADNLSIAYLRQLTDDPSAANRIAEGDPKYDDLTRFITILSQRLPGGRLPGGRQGGASVISFAQSDIVNELTQLFPSMREAVRRAEKTSAEGLAINEAEAAKLKKAQTSGWETYEEAAAATEPVFITRLKCLLDAIRREYAS